MLATPENLQTIGSGLDHPECVCIGADGMLYAGGEAGQVYRISPDGKSQTQYATTGGFALGVAIDGAGRIYLCDAAKATVFRVENDGVVRERSVGTTSRKIKLPNYPVFDRDGNLYVSDSGDYWDATGNGCIFVIRPNGRTELFHAGPFRFANGLAISPDHRWLYVVQSTAGNIARVPLDRADGPIEVTHTLPLHTVPDGIAFSADGHLVIACYRPDAIYLGAPDETVELLIEDLTAELLLRPTNVAIGDGRLFIANLGGWHIASIETALRPAPIYRPDIG